MADQRAGQMTQESERTMHDTAVYSDQALADIALVQQAYDDWRGSLARGPEVPTMAELVVIRLYAAGRLS